MNIGYTVLYGCTAPPQAAIRVASESPSVIIARKPSECFGTGLSGMFSYLPLQVITALKKAWLYLPVFGFGAILYNFRNIKFPFIRK